MSEIEDIRVGDIKHLDSTPPEGQTPNSVMTLEATVEVKPQELKLIRPYIESSKLVPGELSSEGQIIMHALLSCFERQNAVQEGIIDDLVWGFEQAGIPSLTTVKGLEDLYKKRYIKVQAPDNTDIRPGADRVGECWIRYEPKLLALVYS